MEYIFEYSNGPSHKVRFRLNSMGEYNADCILGCPPGYHLPGLSHDYTFGPFKEPSRELAQEVVASALQARILNLIFLSLRENGFKKASKFVKMADFAEDWVKIPKEDGERNWVDESLNKHREQYVSDLKMFIEEGERHVAKFKSVLKKQGATPVPTSPSINDLIRDLAMDVVIYDEVNSSEIKLSYRKDRGDVGFYDLDSFCVVGDLRETLESAQATIGVLKDRYKMELLFGSSTNHCPDQPEPTQFEYTWQRGDITISSVGETEAKAFETLRKDFNMILGMGDFELVKTEMVS